MPFVLDPNSLPEKPTGQPDRKVKPSTIILWLLYPVVLAVGLVVGVVIGIKQAQNNPALLGNQNTNQPKINSTIVPNANTRVNPVVNTNATGLNVNAVNTNVATNVNSPLTGGDYLRIDAQTQARLNQDEQQEKESTVDQTASVSDILRQQDLISLKYDLKAYFAVRQAYPSTSGVQVHLERAAGDAFYAAMKDFYGGSYNQPIDPESPIYYYGYKSDGRTFELSAYLVSQKRAFILAGP